MHLVAHGLCLLYGDVLWQQTVQLIHQLFAVDALLGLEPRLGVEVCHHHAGVHSRIGAPCSRHADLLAEKRRERPLQLFLHRHPVGLYLPTVVVGSVISESDEVSHRLCKGTKKNRDYQIFS